MARIWPVYDGKEPTVGGPWTELPLSKVVELLKLNPKDFVSDYSTTPRFGDTTRDWTFAGYKRVVVEISPAEAAKTEWKPGFYLSRTKPSEALRILIKDVFAGALGADGVARIEYHPGIDSQGNGALLITVVLSPKGASRLGGNLHLNALVQANERLRPLTNDRTPIISYATEAELKDVGT